MNFFIEPAEGFEPTTPRLQITCSGQLSYAGGLFRCYRVQKYNIFLNLQNFLHFFLIFYCSYFTKH